MTRVQYQAAAKADLVEAWVQMADDSVDRADEYISRLQQICELIADQPEVGVARPDIADGIRSFPVDNTIIYYEMHERTLPVLRVWHAARDPLTLSVDP